MIAVGDLRRIAQARLKDAEVLQKAKRHDGAVYLCGYAMEIALKARICRVLKWAGYPSTRGDFAGYHSFRTHDLDVLLHLSASEAKVKANHFAEWSIVAAWDPNARYRIIGSVSQQDAADMITAAKTPLGGVMKIDIAKLRQLMRDLSKEKGEFSLFGLFLRAEAPDKWDLVVSSPWLEVGKLRALGEFVDRLSAAIGEDQLLSISRVVTLNGDDPALETVTKAVGVEDGLVEIRDSDLFGLNIAHAYVFRAKPPQVPARAS